MFRGDRPMLGLGKRLANEIEDVIWMFKMLYTEIISLEINTPTPALDWFTHNSEYVFFYILYKQYYYYKQQ